MTGEIDSIIVSLFSLRERLSELESKLEQYSSQQIVISLMVSFGVVLGFKAYDYLSFNKYDDYDELDDCDCEQESSEDEDDESVFEEEPSIKTEKPLLYGCGSDSSGFEEN